MRTLASMEKITIKDHDNADNLEIGEIKGWQVIVKKGEFNTDDLVVYFEIDSWIPHELAPFLSKTNEPRMYQGIKGERLKTIKIRGKLSQGLILPISILSSIPDLIIEEGLDVTEKLGILKWEPPESTQFLHIKKAGTFPNFIPKTDQIRIQNCFHKLRDNIQWEISEKLDGTSCTVYYFDNKVGICSRNFILKLNEEDTNCIYINTIKKYKLIEALSSLSEPIALQGEICGPGIQGNKYKLTETKFFIFDVYFIDKKRYANYHERYELLEKLIKLGATIHVVS